MINRNIAGGRGDGAAGGLRSLRSRSGERFAEVGGEVDEITDGDGVVVIKVAIGPGGGGFAEIGCQRDEIGDAHLSITIQVAGEDEEILRVIGRECVAGEIFGGGVIECGGVVGVGEIWRQIEGGGVGGLVVAERGRVKLGGGGEIFDRQ